MCVCVYHACEQYFNIRLKDLIYLDSCPHTHSREEDAAPSSHAGCSALVGSFPFCPNSTLTLSHVHTHTHTWAHVTHENGNG